MSARNLAADSRLLPYESLLYACARQAVDPTANDALDAALSQSGIDWAAFVSMAIRHGVAQPIAYVLHDRADESRIPQDVSACLSRLYRGNADRNRVLFRETASVLHALDEAAIPYLVLKGVALALTVYPYAAMRNFADIDLLVPESRFEDACRVVEARGFVLEGNGVDSEAHHAAYAGTCVEDILSETLAPEFDPVHAPEKMAAYRRRVSLEIHRGPFVLASGLLRRTDPTPFWERAQTLSLPDGMPVRIPCPEVTLVHLAGHAAGHHFHRLLFPLDIAYLLRRHGSTLDWEHVVEVADRFGARVDLYRSLRLVDREFGVGVPTEALDSLCRAEEIAPLAVADIFAAMRSDPAESTWRRWLSPGSAGERLHALRQIVCPPPNKMRRIYGARSTLALSALYLLRPLHLFLRALWTFVFRGRSHRTAGSSPGA